MFPKLLLAAALLTGSAGVAHAEAALEEGFAGALRGCEEWVLRPKSWSGGIAPFVASVGLGDKMGLVKRVDEVSLPPKSLRAGNHYWRINATPAAGYVLVVSDQLPMCHITGGGGVDLQPSVEAVLETSAFRSRWTKAGDQSAGETVTSVYRNLEEPSLSILISRAGKPGGRTDRVQLIATATYKP